MNKSVRSVEGSATLDVLRDALRSALDGTGPAVLPIPADAPAEVQVTYASASASGDLRVNDDVALVLLTSGSTGTPRAVLLTADALAASAAATATRLRGPGSWLLALPPTHVAGVQVLCRAIAAGTEVTAMDLAAGFTPAAFAAAVAQMPAGDCRYASLVPTQLHRLLDDADGTGLAAAARLDAVLVGGAAPSPTLLDRARAAGLAVRVTYGMTETCGGCVYDGVPLDGVHVRTDPSGRIEIAGPVLAAGYLDRPDLDAEAFVTDRDAAGGSSPTRWLRTSDVGALTPAGTLTVLGRADDVIVTGGLNVAPAAVEAELAALDGVGEVCVVGVPDDEWGQVVTAVVVASGAPPTLEAVRDHVARRLSAAAAPRRLVLVDRLPLRGPGKVDRAAALDLLTRTPRTTR